MWGGEEKREASTLFGNKSCLVAPAGPVHAVRDSVLHAACVAGREVQRARRTAVPSPVCRDTHTSRHGRGAGSGLHGCQPAPRGTALREPSLTARDPLCPGLRAMEVLPPPPGPRGLCQPRGLQGASVAPRARPSRCPPSESPSPQSHVHGSVSPPAQTSEGQARGRPELPPERDALPLPLKFCFSGEFMTGREHGPLTLDTCFGIQTAII